MGPIAIRLTSRLNGEKFNNRWMMVCINTLPVIVIVGMVSRYDTALQRTSNSAWQSAGQWRCNQILRGSVFLFDGTGRQAIIH